MIRPTVYLAGPMQNMPDAKCKVWRDSATIALAVLGMDAVNPMDRDYRTITDMDPRGVVEPDLVDIGRSDAMIVEARHGASWGTAMEIVYAFQRGKVIVAIVNEDQPVSYWLLYHAVCVASVGEAVNAVARRLGHG